ncbi:hemin uptake protein HemP [Blastopirellula sp. J2-11]|uniref:hemin uptake protein HemP n=1 Tax=Blastopirellula sp. J2-11 TaxID=2943192 RepID=UPI0021C6D209|nr:hemin uptake protein HemP [Blastopirellula sp. J2-11]UUO06341.1 hemin uptake protein HemP [Blastopirellula sp. J2-11]
MSSDESQRSDDDATFPAAQAASSDSAAAGPQSRIVDSNELMDGNSEILISHKGAFYRLRETRSGKLILQK